MLKANPSDSPPDPCLRVPHTTTHLAPAGILTAHGQGYKLQHNDHAAPCASMTTIGLDRKVNDHK
eukprot:scaffold215612_cov20-Tisochrysis_lutea.AAC.1